MDKDIRFTEKKIDESWKDQAAREKGKAGDSPATPAADKSKPGTEPKTSKPFLNFITSLGFQAMMHLGEIPNPETKTREINIDAAREIIDLLVDLKAKTQGNQSPEESRFFTSALSEIQLKFAQHL